MTGSAGEMLAVRLRALAALAARDAAKRSELLERGELFDGYHQEMEAVHVANADALTAVLDEHGWPGPALVGKDGAAAAWLVAQHAIGLPPFQRRCLALLQEAVAAGEADPRHPAVLEDRIRFNERRPQLYGSVLDWEESGELGPGPLEDADGVDARRADVGLEPLAESVASARENVRREGGTPPEDWAARQAEIADWARRAGWLEG